MPLFRRKSPPPPVFTGPPEDPRWVKSPAGKFNRLLRVDPVKSGLKGVGGVIVIWHAGIKPRWVFVGSSSCLGTYVQEIDVNREIMRYEANGGLYVTWSPIREEYRDGVLKFLVEQMKPLVHNPIADLEDIYPIPVLPPSRSKG